MSLQTPQCQPGDFDIAPQVFLTVAASRVGNVGTLSCLEAIKAKPHTLHCRAVSGVGIVIVVFEVASKELLVSVFLELQRMVLMNVDHGISTLILTTSFPVAIAADIACTYDMLWNLDDCLAFWERQSPALLASVSAFTPQVEDEPTLFVAVRAAGFEVTTDLGQTTMTFSQDEFYDLGKSEVDDEIDRFEMWEEPVKKKVSAFQPLHAPLSTTSTTCGVVKPVATRSASTPPSAQQFLPMSPPPPSEASEAQRVRSQSDSHQWTQKPMSKRRTVSYGFTQDVRGKGSLHQLLKLRVVTAVDKHKKKGGWVAEVVQTCSVSGNLPLQCGDTVLVLARNVNDRWYGKVAHNEEMAGCFSPKAVRVVWSPELR